MWRKVSDIEAWWGGGGGIKELLAGSPGEGIDTGTLDELKLNHKQLHNSISHSNLIKINLRVNLIEK